MTLATIKAYRVKGGAVVNVTRQGRTRRYKVGLKRWHALRHWCNTGGPYVCQGLLQGNALDIDVTDKTWADR